MTTPTPTQQVLQRGSYANDGTGDTLRDAAQKINDNFTYLWAEVWDGSVLWPGRKFVCNSVTGAHPDSGQFSLGDSAQIVRVSRWDELDKSFKASSDSSFSASLSMWSLDSGQLDDWNLVGRFDGQVRYLDSVDHWSFSKTSTNFATSSVDSGGTYYIKIDGVW